MDRHDPETEWAEYHSTDWQEDEPPMPLWKMVLFLLSMWFWKTWPVLVAAATVLFWLCLGLAWWLGVV